MSVGFTNGGGTITRSANCLGTWRCYKPELFGVQYETVPAGCDPTMQSCSIRAKVPSEFPGNKQNPSSFSSYIRLFWTRGGQNAATCGFPGATLNNRDNGDAWIQAGGFSCQNPEGLANEGTYELEATACSALTDCTTRRERTTVVFTGSAVAAALCPPEPPEQDCGEGECESCFGGLGGAGGAGGSSGGAGAGGGAGGAGIGGGAPGYGSGPGLSPGKSGPGARLYYRAGGVGHPTFPGTTEHRVALGWYWTHTYAQRLVEDPDASHVWLLTQHGVFRQFFDPGLDGTYESASPADEYRQLTRSASGYELRDLDGTVMVFDLQGFWQATRDRHGNAKTATYTSTQLDRVDFPDGRHETFAYHPDGKLASITEVGVGGAASRTWSYTWLGDNLERIDRPDGTAWRMAYDHPPRPGYMTQLMLVGTDSSERVLSAWQYDAFGNVVATWKGAGNPDDPDAVDVWRLSFDDPGEPSLTTFIDPLGNTFTQTYERDPVSGKARLAATEGDCPTCSTGPNSQLFYEDALNPLRVTREIDGRGTTTLHSYDAFGQRTSTIEALGTNLERESTWTYDASYPALLLSAERPSVTGDPLDSRRTTITRDSQGHETERLEEGFEEGQTFALITTTVPTAEGQIESVDPPGYDTDDRTFWDYDPARGNLLPLSRTDPIVGDSTFVYDAYNRQTGVTDPNGLVVETSYDVLDRVRSLTERGDTPAEDLVTEHRYNAFGDLFLTVLPRGNVVEYAYDHVGRLLSIERKPDDQPDSHGERVLYTLDAFGHRVREEHQRWDDGAWVTHAATGYEFSTRCHLDKVIQGQGLGTESITEYAYDCEGQLEQIWDPNHPSAGQTLLPSIRYVYDELDRLVEVRQPWPSGGDAVTQYRYDVQDHLFLVTDAEGTSTTYTTSDRDLLTRELSEVSGNTSYQYNEHGELISRTDARNITQTRSVDALDRVTFVDYPDDRLDIVHTYDDPLVPFSLGRLTRMERDGHGIDYRYDRFGRTVQDGELSYQLDENGNREEIGYPGMVIARYTHDYADRQASLEVELPDASVLPVITAATYGPSGPLDSFSRNNGVEESRPYDGRYYPQSITATDSLSTVLLDWAYSTDLVGNPLTIDDLLDPQLNRSYSYQPAQYFLTQGNGPWGSLSWSYDRIGNRLSELRDGGQADAYQYEPNSLQTGNTARLDQIQLGSGGSRDYSFDAAGNQISVTDASTTRAVTYDDASRLTSQNDSAAQAASTFIYDARGFLRQATGLAPNTSPAAIFCNGFESGDTSAWNNPPGGGCQQRRQVRPTYSSDGVLHALDRELSEPFNSSQTYVFYFAGQPAATLERNETDTWQHLTADHLGTPILATTDTGTVQWGGGFEPFGADWNGADGAGVFLRFPGQWVDGSWGEGAAYNLHRWYQEPTGRYNRFDPAGLIRSNSMPYAYASQEPMLFTDPYGLMSCIIISGASLMDIGSHSVALGDHTALLIAGPCQESNSCRSSSPILYDPAGGYVQQFPGAGTSEVLNSEIPGWSIGGFFSYHCSSGSSFIETFCFPTTCCEESQISNRLGAATFPGLCASSVGGAIRGIGPFDDIGPSITPAILRRGMNRLLRRHSGAGAFSITHTCGTGR